MNHMRKIIFSVMTVISLFALASCAKGDGDKDYGVEKVYIPQSMADGGITNVYNVPSGEGEYTYNFQITDETVEVFLGVLRSSNGNKIQCRGYGSRSLHSSRAGKCGCRNQQQDFPPQPQQGCSQGEGRQETRSLRRSRKLHCIRDLGEGIRGDCPRNCKRFKPLSL